MKKTLYFEGAGCVPCNDMENCRIRTAFTNKEGKKIYIEFLSGYKHTKIEYGKNGRKLKNPKWVSEDGYLSCDFCHYITDDSEIDDCNKSRLDCERNIEMKKEFCALFNQKYDNTSYWVDKDGNLMVRINTYEEALKKANWTKGREFIVEV